MGLYNELYAFEMRAERPHGHSGRLITLNRSDRSTNYWEGVMYASNHAEVVAQVVERLTQHANFTLSAREFDVTIVCSPLDISRGTIVDLAAWQYESAKALRTFKTKIVNRVLAEVEETDDSESETDNSLA